MCSELRSKKLYYDSSMWCSWGNICVIASNFQYRYKVNYNKMGKTTFSFGLIQRLIKLTGSLDEELREAAAGVMANIRSLALTTEKIRFQQYQK